MADKEKNTKSFILRVDAETMNAIEAWAADEFRSTNGQLQWIITEGNRRVKSENTARLNKLRGICFRPCRRAWRGTTGNGFAQCSGLRRL